VIDVRVRQQNRVERSGLNRQIQVAHAHFLAAALVKATVKNQVDAAGAYFVERTRDGSRGSPEGQFHR
jgi:hypothetical protein